MPTARAQEAIPAPTVNVGDHWSYRSVNGLTNELQGEFTRQVISVSDKEITASHKYIGKADQTLMYFDRNWNTKDTGRYAYDPAFPSLRFPLRAGEQWTDSYDAKTLGEDSIWHCEASIHVIGPETLTLPNGTLDTIRVDGAHLCNRVGATAAQYQGSSKVWYAPGQNAIARSEYSNWSYGRERTRSVIELILPAPTGFLSNLFGTNSK
jgi:hypothetical protein